MQITDEAKKVIRDALIKEQCNAVRLHTENSCCGKSLQFELVNIKTDEKVDVINELSFLMDDETRQWVKTVTIDANGQNLTMTDNASCCS